MSDKHQHGEQERVPSTRRRKAIPLRMARGPQDYVPGQQEEPAVLTSLGDMLHWAQNWARSRSIWPFRACLKRDDSREIEAVHLEYEKDPIVSNRSDRPSLGLYQRTDSCWGSAYRNVKSVRQEDELVWRVGRAFVMKC